AIGGERRRTVEDLDDVRVARDHPRVEALAPVDRAVVPEPGIERERDLDVSPGLEVEVRPAAGLAHRRGYYPEPGSSLKAATAPNQSSSLRLLTRRGTQRSRCAPYV